MTLAVCMKCGHKKVGALTPCANCRFTPQDVEDQARSIYLSDRILSVPELDNASEALIRGESVAFDETIIEMMINATPFLRDDYLLGIRKTSWIFLGIAILIGSMFGGCLVTLFSLLGS